MKKVIIMLISLALIVVVGGALAFKANLNHGPYCIGYPYVDPVSGSKYCSFDPPGALPVTTTGCIFGTELIITPGTPVEFCISATANINQCIEELCPDPVRDIGIE